MLEHPCIFKYPESFGFQGENLEAVFVFYKRIDGQPAGNLDVFERVLNDYTLNFAMVTWRGRYSLTFAATQSYPYYG